MSTRLIILLVVVVGLAVFFAVRPRVPEGAEATPDRDTSPEEQARLELLKTPLGKRELPGDEPPEPADISVIVEVDPTETKNRLYLYFTEAHGYYVEELAVEVYHRTRNDTTGEENLAYFLRHPFNIYIEANKTLRHCIELVPGELERIGGDIGTSEDWIAEVVSHGRARLEDPDPLPPLSKVSRCP